LLSRSGGPQGPPRCGLCRVCMFYVRFEVGLVLCVFFAGFKQDYPGFLGDPRGCPRQM
jgi:hypothetical protein